MSTDSRPLSSCNSSVRQMHTHLYSIPFDHHSPKYHLFCGNVHSRKAIYIVTGWVIYQLINDLVAIFIFNMSETMQMIYSLSTITALFAILSLFNALRTKNELLIWPTIAFLMSEIIASYLETVWAVATLVFPESAIAKQFDDYHLITDHRSPAHPFFIRGTSVAFYAAMNAIFSMLGLLLNSTLLIITLRFHRYYRDWRKARLQYSPSVAYTIYKA